MLHTMRSTVIKGLMVLAIGAGIPLIVSAAVSEISGAGATLPYPVYAKWAEPVYRR